jgi:hypothetical protein
VAKFSLEGGDLLSYTTIAKSNAYPESRYLNNGDFEKVSVSRSDYDYEYDEGRGKVVCAPDGSCYFTINIEDMKDTIIFGSPVIKQQVKNSSFGLYPNPAKGIVYIRYNPNQTVTSARILNLAGQTVFYSKKTENNKLNIEFLTSGIYLIRIEFSDNSRAIQKLIVKN